MALPPPLEVARRVRAAFAYAGKDVSKDHPELGIGYSTIQRIISTESKKGPRPARRDELEQIANFTKVPLSFFLDGWPSDEPHAGERIEALEHQYGTIGPRIAELETLTAELAGTLRRVAADTARHRRAIRELSDQRLPEEPEEDIP